MSDDIWRSDRDADGDPEGEPKRRPGRLESEMDSFGAGEFGGPLFGDTSEHPAVPAEPDDAGEPLRFGDDSGSMPHWTEPPTGDVPKIASAATGDPTDDLDVWSSFTSDSPVWKEGDHVDQPTGQPPVDPTGELTWEDAPAEPPKAAEVADPAVAGPAAAPAAPREPARITIGTDPSGMPRRPPPGRRGGAPQRPPGAASDPTPDGRNLPVAAAVGLVLAAVFLALTMWRPAGATAFVTVALGLASIEYFSKVTEKGYRPAVAAGVAACVAAPLTAYWVGERMFPIVLAFAFFAAAVGFIGAHSVESGPMPNMAITMLGVVWIGMLGSFAVLILRFSNFFGGDNPIGTDTLVLVAIGVVANDVGAYFVGTAFGRTPLRSWISPNKSFEGFLGGTILTLVVMLIIGIQEYSDSWSDTSHLLMLALVISLMAPLGDLTESMFKRNLDVKDFGSLIKGHGGVLDRFDGFLFALPGVYYLMLVVEPWTSFSG